MKTYKIIWQSIMLGNSKVKAINKEEAREKTLEGFDYDWKRFAFNTKWVISKIEIIKESK